MEILIGESLLLLFYLTKFPFSIGTELRLTSSKQLIYLSHDTHGTQLQLAVLAMKHAERRRF